MCRKTSQVITTSESTVSSQHQDQHEASLVSLSALNPGDHVIEQEEDHDQAHRDVAEDAAVVPS